MANVGKSWRTTAKHGLMGSIVGQEVGVVGLGNGDDRHVFYDLCAGDGVVDYEPAWEQMCSPGILARHAMTAAKNGKRALVLLHEIQPNTYDRLLNSLAGPWGLPLLGYVPDGEGCWRIGDMVELRAVNASGQTADVSFLGNRDAVLVFNDPNAITEWAMREGFAAEVPSWRCRILSTMGCNPAGLKRLPLVERLGWFPLIEAQQAALPGYRDLLLAAIQRDDAQWAYLLSTSQNWRPQTEALFRTEFKKVGRATEMAWWRQDPGQFREVLLRLFLTRNEEDARELIRGEEDYWLSLDTEQRYRFLTERGARES